MVVRFIDWFSCENRVLAPVITRVITDKTLPGEINLLRGGVGRLIFRLKNTNGTEKTTLCISFVSCPHLSSEGTFIDEGRDKSYRVKYGGADFRLLFI